MVYKEVEALSEDELYDYDFSRHGILFRERLVELRKDSLIRTYAISGIPITRFKCFNNIIIFKLKLTSRNIEIIITFLN